MLFTPVFGLLLEVVDQVFILFLVVLKHMLLPIEVLLFLLKLLLLFLDLTKPCLDASHALGLLATLTLTRICVSRGKNPLPTPHP